jgi:hypothetical protein
MDQDISLSREDIILFWNAAVYGVSFYVLGFGLLKALLIMPLVFVCVAFKYGSRWVLCGFRNSCVGGPALDWRTSSVDQWHELPVSVASWTVQNALAAR